MSPSWYHDIDLWFKKYHFDEQVMIALFKYCLERSALHRNYIQAVAEGWHQNKIQTFTDLDTYYAKQEKLTTIKKIISKKLGYTRAFTAYESAYIEKWSVEYGYGLDVIEIALKKTTSKTNPNFDYLDKLISDWHDRKLTHTNDVQAYLIEIAKKNKEIKQLKSENPKKNTYNQYEQRKQENLDNLYTDAKQALNG